jgi:hypothetical protein
MAPASTLVLAVVGGLQTMNVTPAPPPRSHTIPQDNSRSLWCRPSRTVPREAAAFTPAQIAVSGAPVPATVITGSSLSAPFGIAFDPHPAGLPIKP